MLGSKFAPQPDYPLLVTHDLDEAILLGNRIVVLCGTPGRVCLSVDVPIPYPRTPQDLRFHPAYPQLRHQLWAALHTADRSSLNQTP